MYDLSKELIKFHNDHIRLTDNQRKDMKNRRDANLKRIKNGLENLSKPNIVESINQGGYAQKTMVQPPESDKESRYDIDLGVVFDEDDAVGAQTTRSWVRNAIANAATNLKNVPESKKKCVRVVYADGYQCDFPVFQRSLNGFEFVYELSSGNAWDESDPKAMNAWIEEKVSEMSPEESGYYQLRRIIRLGKFYNKTHSAHQNRKFPSGLVATALFIEAYGPVEGRDDEAFYETLRNISYRSKDFPVYANDVQVSDDKDTDRIARLIERARKSVEELDDLNNERISQADACKAWKKVFRHSYFDEIVEEEKTNTSTHSVLTGIGLGAGTITANFRGASALSHTEKMERLESEVSMRRERGESKKPWST